jgi:hypothetical protein
MTIKIDLRWVILLAANALFWCMLSFQQTQGAGTRAAAPSGLSGPSATLQRAEIIAQLKEIKAEIKALVTFRQNGALPTPEPSQP